MITTVFIIVLEFRNVDECWDYYHDKDLTESALKCHEVHVAPEWTVKPQYRPEDLGGGE